MAQIHSTTKHWAKIVDEHVDRVDEEWDHCNQSWDKINQSMEDLQFPTFGSPMEFRPIDEVATDLRQSVDGYKEQIQQITTMEKGHMKKHVINQAKIVDRMEQIVDKMEKHTLRYHNRSMSWLCQWINTSSHFVESCTRLFREWSDYVEEHASPKTPRSPESS
jgi:hypothetical protein